jgi:hypothetical protein
VEVPKPAAKEEGVMVYENVYVRFLWANWQTRNAWIWIWDFAQSYFGELDRWFRVRDDNWDSIQNMLAVAAMARVNGASITILTDGPVGNNPVYSASKIMSIACPGT